MNKFYKTQAKVQVEANLIEELQSKALFINIQYHEKHSSLIAETIQKKAKRGKNKLDERKKLMQPTFKKYGIRK